MVFQFEPIGVIHSCFREKFGIPRQSGLVPAAKARLELFSSRIPPESLSGIESFSHLWVVFIFHKVLGLKKKPMVRPPRLGGNKRVGVFSTRSPFRPNPIGISVVEMEAVCIGPHETVIHIKGADLLDGTPVLDIKPYVGWSDIVEAPACGFASERPKPRLSVVFSKKALSQCMEREAFGAGNPKPLIEQVLELDPRPAYHHSRSAEASYRLKLIDFDLAWRVEGETAVVISLEPIKTASQDNPSTI